MLNLIEQVRAVAKLEEIGNVVLPDSKFDNLTGLVAGVWTWIFSIVTALVVVAIVYSGIMYITAGGDSAKAEKAKNNLTWAIIGLVVAILSLVIIQWVNNVLNTGTA